jgi:uncharacterized protein YdhG (YjbR/CyaY superfamily)
MVKAKTAGPKDGEAYIRSFPEEVQALLRRLQAAIREAAPAEAVETISYGMPTFKLNGRYLVYFAAYKQHLAVYPVPEGSAALTKALAPYVTGKGTARFALDEPLPLGLIKRMVKALTRENRERAAAPAREPRRRG